MTEKKVVKKLKIVVNGETYSSVDEVPEKYREAIRKGLELGRSEAAGNAAGEVRKTEFVSISGNNYGIKVDEAHPNPVSLSGNLDLLRGPSLT
jgi:hypothetical protein